MVSNFKGLSSFGDGFVVKNNHRTVPLITVFVGLILFRFIDTGFLLIYIVIAVVIGEPIKKAMQKASYNRIIRKV